MGFYIYPAELTKSLQLSVMIWACENQKCIQRHWINWYMWEISVHQRMQMNIQETVRSFWMVSVSLLQATRKVERKIIRRQRRLVMNLSGSIKVCTSNQNENRGIDARCDEPAKSWLSSEMDKYTKNSRSWGSQSANVGSSLVLEPPQKQVHATERTKHTWTPQKRNPSDVHVTWYSRGHAPIKKGKNDRIKGTFILFLVLGRVQSKTDLPQNGNKCLTTVHRNWKVNGMQSFHSDTVQSHAIPQWINWTHLSWKSILCQSGENYTP